jgi:hypothetical protein
VPVNADKPHLWKQDIALSVDLYNSWFMQFAPVAYRQTRINTTQQVESALAWTVNLTNITPATLRQHPSVLPILRMATAPPIARDRLIGARRCFTQPRKKYGGKAAYSTENGKCVGRYGTTKN